MAIAATPATVPSESSLKQFYANTQKWLADTWNKLPTEITTAPPKLVKKIYQPENWASGLLSGVLGYMNISGPSMTGDMRKDMTTDFGKLIATTTGLLLNTTKGAVSSLAHMISPAQKKSLDKAKETTTAAMQASGLVQGINGALKATVDWMNAFVAGGVGAKTA